MEKLNLDNRSLGKFGMTMAAAFLVITLIILFRHKHSVLPTFLISVAFFILANIRPAYLRPIYTGWMRLAFILGWINTRLILIILFYLVFTPIGLMMRACGADPLDRRIEKNKESYWKKKDNQAFRKENYEHQF